MTQCCPRSLTEPLLLLSRSDQPVRCEVHSPHLRKIHTGTSYCSHSAAVAAPLARLPLATGHPIMTPQDHGRPPPAHHGRLRRSARPRCRRTCLPSRTQAACTRVPQRILCRPALLARLASRLGFLRAIRGKARSRVIGNYVSTTRLRTMMPLSLTPPSRIEMQVLPDALLPVCKHTHMEYHCSTSFSFVLHKTGRFTFSSLAGA